MLKYLKKFNSHNDYDAYINGSDKVLPNVSLCVNENDVHYTPSKNALCKINVTDATKPIQLYDYDDTGELYGIAVFGVNMFEKIEIDGVEASLTDLDNAEGKYLLSEGEHTIKYTLKEPELVGLNVYAIFDPDSQEPKYGALFNTCEDITNITFPYGVKNIYINAVPVGQNVTSVGTVGSNSSIEIPNSVTYIGVGVFGQCTDLANVTIPNSVNKIDYNAFMECAKLESVTIGSGVTSIGEGAFDNCSKLDSITSLAKKAPTIDNNTFMRVKTDGTLTVPSGSTGYDVWMGTDNYYLGYYNWTKVEQ